MWSLTIRKCQEKDVHPESGLLTNREPGSEFTYTHDDDVAEGTTYTYRVSAFNDAGQGHPSASSATASIDAVLPGAPTGLTATADMDAPSITLGCGLRRWRPEALTLLSWKIEVSEDYDAADPDAATVGEPGHSSNRNNRSEMADPPTTMFSAVHAGLNAWSHVPLPGQCHQQCWHGRVLLNVDKRDRGRHPKCAHRLDSHGGWGKYDQFVLDCTGGAERRFRHYWLHD